MKKLFIVLSVIAVIMVVTCLAFDAPPMIYLLCFGVLVIVFFITAPLFKQADELLSSGKIITRDPSFVETAQVFSLSKVSMDSLIAAMKSEGLPFAGLEWKTSDGAMRFRYNGWAAQMVKIDNDDGSHDKFRFSFTGWQTLKYSAVMDITQMNQLLTAIEKAFIRLDHSTKVATERVKIQTKNSFF